ncbi:helix-turn-helix transcriptional regulator [Streptomyces sp. NPDC002795]|uniref:helix-turn-helix domain-containing protein n=1 Tax=Streptomyces sp. NPDC002795 TaxID=3364665 RepID=UPI00367B3A5C
MGSTEDAQAGCRPKRQAGEDDYPAIWVAYGKLFRKKRSKTQQELADATGYSYEQVASIEQGRRPAKVAFTEAAERVLEAGGVLAELQDDVERAKLPKFFQDFALIETEAVSRFAYDPLLVPGLLQTGEFARALLLAHCPLPTAHCPVLDEETVEHRVEGRLNRQKLLLQTPPVEFSFIVGESALVNTVRDAELMSSQLQHLLRVGSSANVELQVMPIESGVHTGLNGAFVLLETLEHRHFGYLEAQQVGMVISDPAKVSAFGLRYGELRSQALNVEESARLIERLAGAA